MIETNHFIVCLSLADYPEIPPGNEHLECTVTRCHTCKCDMWISKEQLKLAEEKNISAQGICCLRCSKERMARSGGGVSVKDASTGKEFIVRVKSENKNFDDDKINKASDELTSFLGETMQGWINLNKLSLSPAELAAAESIGIATFASAALHISLSVQGDRKQEFFNDVIDLMTKHFKILQGDYSD